MKLSKLNKSYKSLYNGRKTDQIIDPWKKTQQGLRHAFKKAGSEPSLSMSGSKGGRVARQRKEIRRIDTELRGYAYR